MMASDWSAEVAAQPIGNKKGHDSFKQANSPDILTVDWHRQYEPFGVT